MACSRPPLPTTSKFNQHPRRHDELARCRHAAPREMPGAATVFNAQLHAGLAPRTQSVPEVAYAGHNHSYAALVRGGYDFVVAHAAARLYHRTCTGVDHNVEPVPEGEKSIGRDHRAVQAQAGILRLNRS